MEIVEDDAVEVAEVDTLTAVEEVEAVASKSSVNEPSPPE